MYRLGPEKAKFILVSSVDAQDLQACLSASNEISQKVAPILGHTINFVQDNESMSSYGVMRGLHFQRPPYTQSLREGRSSGCRC